MTDVALRIAVIVDPSLPAGLLANTVATVDETGRISMMTPVRFTSWVESYLSFTWPGKETPRVESIGKDSAGKILAADQFRVQLRELKGVAEVRLPVWTGKGEGRTVELAPEGFNTETGIFTVPRVTYQEDMTCDDGAKTLHEVLCEFPFDPDDGEPVVRKRRSYSAQIAAMLGVYCHALFPEGTPKPMIVHNANQSGSGKSLLMRIVLAPVYGAPAESGKPETEAELEKVLDSAAIARKPFLVLDDCKSIHSQALNRFVTSPVHECRLMHSQRMATVPKVTQVFATGNGLTISADLDRRALVIDLFEPGEAAARSFSREITPGWLFSAETRARVLAALWALVRGWRDEGMPMMQQHRRGSFEEWSGLIGGIVTSYHSLANPFAPRLVEMGGDESTRALKIVLAQIVGAHDEAEPLELNTAGILEHAETIGLVEVIAGWAKDPKKSLGHKLKALKGRHLQDTQGRFYEFGKRDIASGAKYVVRFLDRPDQPPKG